MRIPFARKIAGVFNRFVDGKFQNYRGQISNKIAHAGAYLTAFLILWTLFLLFLFFGGIALGLFIERLTHSYLLGFSIVMSLAFLTALVVFLYRDELIIKPVYIALNTAMDGQEPEEIVKPPKKIKKANLEAQKEELKEKIKKVSAS